MSFSIIFSQGNLPVKNAKSSSNETGEYGKEIVQLLDFSNIGE